MKSHRIRVKVVLLRQVLAFLLANGLIQRSLIVFVDGQRSLHAALAQVFNCWRSWRSLSRREAHPPQQVCESRIAADWIPNRLVFKKGSDRSGC